MLQNAARKIFQTARTCRRRFWCVFPMFHMAEAECPTCSWPLCRRWTRPATSENISVGFHRTAVWSTIPKDDTAPVECVKKTMRRNNKRLKIVYVLETWTFYSTPWCRFVLETDRRAIKRIIWNRSRTCSTHRANKYRVKLVNSPATNTVHDGSEETEFWRGTRYHVI